MTEEKTLADMFGMKFDKEGKVSEINSSANLNIARKLNRKERRSRDKKLGLFKKRKLG